VTDQNGKINRSNYPLSGERRIAMKMVLEHKAKVDSTITAPDEDPAADEATGAERVEKDIGGRKGCNPAGIGGGRRFEINQPDEKSADGGTDQENPG
jgi:hypothetical protein